MAQDSSRPDFWESRYQGQVTPWDAGTVPAQIAAYARTLDAGARVLIPGCGSGYEVAAFADAGMDVVALDFSEAAIERARMAVPRHADRFQLADVFAFDPGPGFDLVYERAFLCALPRRLWDACAERYAAFVRPGKSLAGYWFFDDNERGPPFGISQTRMGELFSGAFECVEDAPVPDSIPVFAGKERWQVWRRRDTA